MASVKGYSSFNCSCLDNSRAASDDERIRRAQPEGAELIEHVRTELDNSTVPTDTCVQSLAERWPRISHMD